MCGRYSLTTPVEALRRLFGVTDGLNLPARYNIAPTQDVPIVRNAEDGSREMVMVRWGLIPSWAKATTQKGIFSSPLINARGETVGTKPAFAESYRSRRCLMPADGYFEWQKQEGRKQPYWVHRKSNEPFAFAGIWDQWRGPDGARVQSCAIITAVSTEPLSDIHGRMPIILDPSQYDNWLDNVDGNKSQFESVLAQPLLGGMDMYPVSKRVNNVRNEGPDCLVAFKEDEEVAPRLL
jgi:putative SOS response-associated peptidase YedK